jgi:hypothetical protein
MIKMSIPGVSGVPVIVYVLPEPVVPYANTHALYPSMTDLISYVHVFW